jgi:hypothetical protein
MVDPNTRHDITLGPFVAEGLSTFTVDGQPIAVQTLMFTCWMTSRRVALYEISAAVEPNTWPTPAGENFTVDWNGQRTSARVVMYRYADQDTISIGWPVLRFPDEEEPYG